MKEITEKLKIFNLLPGAALNDVKKAYRALAKENHPDHVADPAQKHAREERMARINGAYRDIIVWMKHPGKTPVPPAREREHENDTSLYKKGAALYDKYTGSISLKFKDIAIELDKLLEKKRDIEAARDCFTRLLNEYPDSDWAYDSGERLKKIEKTFPNLISAIEFVRTHELGRTPKGTPVWKEKE